MPSEPTRTPSPATAHAAAQDGQRATAEPEPPVAKRVPHERTHHGDTVIDEYAWLADKEDPDTIPYLTAENAYTEAMTAGQAGLRETIFAEIKGRTQETDLSVPARKGGWWYYTRTVEGRQYPVHCRRAVRLDETRPPGTDGGGPLPGEEVLLDCNELAGTRRSSPSAPSRSARTAGSSPTRRTWPVRSGSSCGSRIW